jgi:hypothetical protein
MILLWDFSITLPLALIPLPSFLSFSAKVLSLDIAVPVRSLNLLAASFAYIIAIIDCLLILAVSKFHVFFFDSPYLFYISRLN